jgi:hypothetical protein
MSSLMLSSGTSFCVISLDYIATEMKTTRHILISMRYEFRQNKSLAYLSYFTIG